MLAAFPDIDDAEVNAVFHKILFGFALSACIAGCAHVSHPAQEKLASAPPAGCVYPGTATRLPVRPSECAGFGRSWSQDDLKRTGKPEVGQALQMLDPSVSAHP